MTITEPTTNASPAACTAAAPRSLEPDLLLRFRQRACDYDRHNSFFTEDFEELRDIGYLRAAAPARWDGWGMSLTQLASSQRLLARHAPATALATTMHHYWVGLAADFQRLGSPLGATLLEKVARGEVFASGHAESGIDVPIVASSTRAEPVDGGYRVTGRKHFTSLSPVWTVVGLHAMDATSDPDRPVIVHAFVDRSSPGITVLQDWDTLGMRASQSHSTELDDVFVPHEAVAAVVPVGDPTDPLVAMASIWALTLISNVYLGIAERAFELAVENATSKSAVTIPRGSYATHPFIQHQIAEMYLDLHAARATLDGLAADWTDGVDHGAEWAAMLFSAKWRTVDVARRVVSTAMDVVGGGSFYRRSELERLYRDVRAGAHHPPNDAYAHEAIAKMVLGIGTDGPRW